MKTKYLDLMEKALEAYTGDHIQRYFDAVQAEGMTEHGFPRLTANMGILISKGRKTELLPLFCRMMDFVCESFLKVKAANDFSVKEIIFCIMELDGKEIVKQERIAYWKSLLKEIEPYECYNVCVRTPDELAYNWACFTAVSEFMRQHIGLADTTEIVDIQLGSQMRWLDESGMYMEPNNPMVYDMVPRGLFAILLHFGYQGKYRKVLEDCLEKASLLTLKMQSVSGEIPYGGRSNQFLHNEAHLAILLEHGASLFAAKGDYETAGAFKAATQKALGNIEKWLSQQTIHHVKNYYPIQSLMGCEDYAYFDKYMITAASFMYVAYLLCDETIPVGTWDRRKPYTLKLTPPFHKIFLNAGGYFAEYDWEADPHYDASGLGRVHKEGVPEAICISVPCPEHPEYHIDAQTPAAMSICPGFMGTDGPVFALGNGETHIPGLLDSDDKKAVAEIKTQWEDRVLDAEYAVSEQGVEITVIGSGDVVCMLTAFTFDGEQSTQIEHAGNILRIGYKGHWCTYTTDGEIADLGRDGGNRNGRYHAYFAKGSGCLKVRIVLE